MKMKPMILMLVAVACGLIAMVGVQQTLGSRGDSAGPKIKVLVARKEVQAGTPLDETCVGFKLVSKSEAPEDVISTKEEYEKRAPRVKLYEGQYVHKKQLGEKGEYGASMEIPNGMRVVTVPVTATMTHSGLLSPGDRVDVQVTYSYTRPKVGKSFKTRTVLQYIEVWATDAVRMGTEASKEDSSQSKNVSLLVYPGQGALLQLAQEKGQIHLLLRGRNDKAPAEQTGDLDEAALDRKLAELFDEPEDAPQAAATSPQEVASALPDSPSPTPAPPQPSFSEFLNTLETPVAPEPPAPPKPTWKVEIFNGDKKQVAEFELPDDPNAPPAPAKANAKPTGGWLGMLGLGKPKTQNANSTNSKAAPSSRMTGSQPNPAQSPSANQAGDSVKR
jgi:pilus assembly protein CpaB